MLSSSALLTTGIFFLVSVVFSSMFLRLLLLLLCVFLWMTHPMNMFQSKTIQPLEIRHISFTSISGNTYEKPILVVFHQIKEGFANNMISLVTNYVITVLVDGVLYCLRSCLFLHLVEPDYLYEDLFSIMNLKGEVVKRRRV